MTRIILAEITYIQAGAPTEETEEKLRNMEAILKPALDADSVTVLGIKDYDTEGRNEFTV